MLNQVVLVGRLVKDPELNETEDKEKRGIITLAIPRSYKNAEGEYDTDYIKCFLWNGVAENTKEYCHKGDMVGVRGRLEDKNIVIAEKLTFLSSKKKEEE